MPREDWAANAPDRILGPEGLWPFAPGELRTVLDVGCGLSLKSQYLDIPTRVALDIFPEYLERIEAAVPFVPLIADVRALDVLFPPKSFDLVIALDIIEHVDKLDSRALIHNCERLARRAVVLATPEGYVPQNLDILGHGGDHWQTHRCGWEVSELQALGYSCVTRPYRMSDVKRHTVETVDPNVTMIHAIKLMEGRR